MAHIANLEEGVHREPFGQLHGEIHTHYVTTGEKAMYITKNS
jgi:hypothetical protein